MSRSKIWLVLESANARLPDALSVGFSRSKWQNWRRAGAGEDLGRTEMSTGVLGSRVVLHATAGHIC